MEKPDWEKARQKWLASLSKNATKTQNAEIAELKELGTFSDIEIIFQVFGWRAPVSQEIWNSKSNKIEKMGMNESVYYLLRVVLGISLHPAPKDITITDLTKSKLKDLIIVGIENGHVETSGKDIGQSVRAAINEVFDRLEIKTIKAEP